MQKLNKRPLKKSTNLANNKPTIQIGVMGSSADLKYSAKVSKLAEEIGQAIAKAGAILVFGAEKDYDSLSTVASRAAQASGGLTVGLTYGKKTPTFSSPSVTIATGLDRGGGREFSLVLSCDAIITIGGGSGTLNEMVIAYQAGIPIVALESTGGWSQRLAGEYFDERQRLKVETAKTANQAVSLAIKLATA